jgi:hypothetical protein
VNWFQCIINYVISNPSLLGPVYYQPTLELDNIPEIDVAEQKQRLGEDMPIALVFCYEYFLQSMETYLSRYVFWSSVQRKKEAKLIVWLKNAKNPFSRPLTLNNFFCRCGSDGDFLHFFYNGVPNIRTNFQLYANYSNLTPTF